jgi:hypothetical protein
LQELKQRASGDTDKQFMNPGISEKQPLHVVMVRVNCKNVVLATLYMEHGGLILSAFDFRR